MGLGETGVMLEEFAQVIFSRSDVVFLTTKQSKQTRGDQSPEIGQGRRAALEEMQEAAAKATVVLLKGGFCFIFHLSKGVNLRKPYSSCGLLALKGK